MRFCGLDNEKSSISVSEVQEERQKFSDFLAVGNLGLNSKEQSSTAAGNLLKELPGQSKP